jgi:ubiquinone/menaquinone biosynthesis C-methylase UbiE
MSFKKFMASHLRQPHGFIGKLVGLLMNKGNDFINRFTLEQLNLIKGDHILEIGFGNGKYIYEIAQQNQNGIIAGVDYSKTMVQEAKKKNQTFIHQSIVHIKHGTSDQIPFENNYFDKVYTVNTIYFWQHPENDLKEMLRVLKPGGKLLISFVSKKRMEKIAFTKYQFRLYEPDEIIQMVTRMGFEEIEWITPPDSSSQVNCILSTKPLTEAKNN